MRKLPEIGFLRLAQIIGDPKANPPIPAIIPISRSAWLEGVKAGRYPPPVRLGPRTVAWRVEDILDVVTALSGQDEVDLLTREQLLQGIRALASAYGHGVGSEIYGYSLGELRGVYRYLRRFASVREPVSA
jgi:predicted DNA-binding transcriptional regulator AlpA